MRYWKAIKVIHFFVQQTHVPYYTSPLRISSYLLISIKTQKLRKAWQRKSSMTKQKIVHAFCGLQITQIKQQDKEKTVPENRLRNHKRITHIVET